jgi:uncharacterized protein YchJ
MNIDTGVLLDQTEVEKLPLNEQRRYIPVVRDLTEHEKANKQIALYSPCGCGSGKKFKFCCHIAKGVKK